MNYTSLEGTIKNYETEKNQKIAVVREKVTREQIVPFNADIDSSRAKAISELNNELNQKVSAINTETNNKISALRKEYEDKKQELINLGEQKKKENSETVLANETAAISVEYDSIIAELTEILNKIKK